MWLQDYIGVSLDYKIGKKTVPMFKYFFWPKTDAWEDIKTHLESLDILSYEDFVFVLNNITDVINFWQQNNKSFDNKTFQSVKLHFPLFVFIGYN